MAILASGVALSASACGAAAPKVETAHLKVIAEPAEASVYVNDRFVGTARVLALKPKALRPGVKFVTFEAPNHFPHDLRVELPPGTTTVEIKLRPVPP